MAKLLTTCEDKVFMASKPVHISITSHPENLIQIRHAIADALSKCFIEKQECDNIILAIDEACSNIIRHGYQNDHTQNIDLTFTIKKDCLSITVLDKGVEFDINSIEQRDVSQVKPGGLGLYIIKNVMDKVEYCRTPDGCNKLAMTKNLSG